MKIDKSLPVHYSYKLHHYEEGVTIVLSKFYPVRETPCFYWLIDGRSVRDDFELIGCPKPFRVGKYSSKSKYQPSKEFALNSLKMRQLSRVWHNEFSISIATQALKSIDKVDLLSDNPTDCGKPDFFDGMIWP